MVKNEYALKYEGKEIRMRYGTIVHAMFKKETGKNMADIDVNNIEELAVFMHACAECYAKKHKTEESFDKEDAYFWIDEMNTMDQEDIQGLFEALFDTPVRESEGAKESAKK
jgi:hypothetical protein